MLCLTRGVVLQVVYLAVLGVVSNTNGISLTSQSFPYEENNLA